MIEVRNTVFHQLPPEGKRHILRELAYDSFGRITRYQFNNGLIPASLGRYDDPYFKDMVWVKDHARATRHTLDPLVKTYLPELNDPVFIAQRGLGQTADQLYLSAARGMLLVQAQPEQLARFQTRPGPADEHGYSTIDDRFAPAIKFYGPNGSIHYDWGHNQPDNWGTLLLEVGKGIKAGLPLLEQTADYIPGKVLQHILSYVVNLRAERLVCRSIWEHNNAWSSYSTRRIVLASLGIWTGIWPAIEKDSREHGYPLLVDKSMLRKAAGNLKLKVNEHKGDYTDDHDHASSGDLASLVVANDIDIPKREAVRIFRRIKDADLESRQGIYRYIGDPWKHGRAEAMWTLGKPIMARYYFGQAIGFYQANHLDAATRALTQGMDRIQDILDIIAQCGYMPELFEEEKWVGSYKANNNELAWKDSYIIEAAAAGLAAIAESERSTK